MTAALFIAFLALTATAVVAVVARYFGGRTAVRVLAGLSVWCLYAGLLGYLGVFKKTSMRPPGIAFLFIPLLLLLIIFVVFIVRSPPDVRLALAIPLWITIGFQCFRVGVELFLHQLWIEGLLPKMLTFNGANVDIYIGLTAPLIAWLCTRRRFGINLALTWNVLGLLSLANVMIRAVLTVPGPLNLIHSEVPNRMIGTFPFMFIPAFFVPLAVALHVLAIRAIFLRMRPTISVR